MNRLRRSAVRLALIFLCGVLMPGCFAAFSRREAREVSRERLLQISEKGTTDHLQYRGSDFGYHYVFDTRPGKERSYKVSVTSMPLAETFPVGDDFYVLHPWVIEGKLMGTKVDDVDEEMRKAARKSQAGLSGVGRAPQAVVEGPAESGLGEEVGDDQVEPGSVETP